MTYDVIIIGGSFAGMAAAMQLVRAQRQVLIIDANHPRNRFAHASHGVFGLDGKSPAEIREIGLSQLFAYPTFHLWNDVVESLEQTADGFIVATQQQQTAQAKRIILASGIHDKLPEIEGLAAFWGKNVVHCPYCHGYELRNNVLGVLATSEMALHLAAMIPDWGKAVLFTQGQFEPDAESSAHLQEREVVIKRSPVVEVRGDKDIMTHVILQDGECMALGGLFVGPKIGIPSPLIQHLNLEMQETPMGDVIKVSDFKESSIPGLFVAGDLSNPMQSGTLAVASGTMAGIGAHRSLVFDT